MWVGGQLFVGFVRPIGTSAALGTQVQLPNASSSKLKPRIARRRSWPRYVHQLSWVNTPSWQGPEMQDVLRRLPRLTVGHSKQWKYEKSYHHVLLDVK